MEDSLLKNINDMSVFILVGVCRDEGYYSLEVGQVAL